MGPWLWVGGLKSDIVIDLSGLQTGGYHYQLSHHRVTDVSSHSLGPGQGWTRAGGKESHLDRGEYTVWDF